MSINRLESAIEIIERKRGVGKGGLYRQEIPDSTELNQVRRNLSDLHNNISGNSNVDGVVLIQPVLERPLYEDCGIYLSTEENIILSEVLFNGENIPKSELSAIACYFNKEGDFRHVGRVIKNGLIRSKWGVPGGVYEHQPELVPDSYGDTIIYFRQPVT